MLLVSLGLCNMSHTTTFVFVELGLIHSCSCYGSSGENDSNINSILTHNVTMLLEWYPFNVGDSLEPT